MAGALARGLLASPFLVVSQEVERLQRTEPAQIDLAKLLYEGVLEILREQPQLPGVGAGRRGGCTA